MLNLKKTLVVAAVAILGLGGVVACTKQEEASRTYNNRVAINGNIPVPEISFSARRYVLATFYKQVLENSYLRTCTTISSRGGGSQDTTEAIAETLGVPVNLGFQMTDPDIEEADSLYPPQSTDQTVVVLRNGVAVITENDTTSVIGDCVPGDKPNTRLQRLIDFQASQPEGSGQANFIPSQELLNQFGKK